MASEANHNEGREQVPVLVPFDPTKKKKKNKTTTTQAFIDENADPFAEKMENLTVSAGAEASFAGLKKKKKKNPVDPKLFSDVDADDNGDDEYEDASDHQLQPSLYPLEEIDRDYTYEEILGRVFNVLRENNPELAGDRRRTVMRPPQVMREGTKKTVFANFTELCKMMHRQPDHVMSFFLAEMSTDGCLDGQQRLVVKGRFAPKNFEALLRRYINEYVICNGCKSSDTILLRENRVNFLRCEQCGSGRSVLAIRKGYVARLKHGHRNAA